jgi:hypothetical protein
MVQNGVQVSTPSSYATNGNNGVTGFSVSYTGNEGSASMPALIQIGRVAKGKLLHPIFHRTNRQGNQRGRL